MVILFILYVCVIIGVGIYLLTLLSRFVGAHERIARALEDTARNSHSEGR
jgi:hypothetical protein